VVDLEGEFVPLGGERALCSRDQAGVVDQHVDPGMLAPELGRELPHLV
jgi:hypothetical protein